MCKVNTRQFDARDHDGIRQEPPADRGWPGGPGPIDLRRDGRLARRSAPGRTLGVRTEADATIPAEYILLRHYLGEPVDGDLEGKIASYLRRIQGSHGGWPLFHGGDLDISASVKAYFALKMVGDDPQAEHMRRAREAICERGGAAKCNVFTRALLALFGVLSWRAVPVMPVEIMLLPKWFPLHLNKMSYWARTVIVPLLVLGALKPRARNPREIGVDELFLERPELSACCPRRRIRV